MAPKMPVTDNTIRHFVVVYLPVIINLPYYAVVIVFIIIPAQR